MCPKPMVVFSGVLADSVGIAGFRRILRTTVIVSRIRRRSVQWCGREQGDCQLPVYAVAITEGVRSGGAPENRETCQFHAPNKLKALVPVE